MNRITAGIFVIALFVGCNQPQQSSPVASAEVEAAKIKTVSVRVEGMMCPHGCYPQVKSLIEKQNIVESIELTPQKDEDTIDNPVVLVQYRGNLNKEGTTKAILAAGFESVKFLDQ